MHPHQIWVTFKYILPLFCLPSSTHESQFLFIDLLLILPIAIFSKTGIPTWNLNLTHTSGVDWSLSCSMSQTTNRKPGVKKSIDSPTGADRYLHIDPGCEFPGRPETTLVSSVHHITDPRALTFIGLSHLTWTEKNPTSRILRTLHCS